ncbi:uncharacterized protein [Anabrus simplex]|uniref:uncharacterized protein n=1 Tax=Anabrus simplex TaxID=316456 RepID=UPI0035A36F5A
MAILTLLIFASVGGMYTYKIWNIDPHVARPSALFIPVYSLFSAYFTLMVCCYRKTLNDEKEDGNVVEDGEKKPLVDKPSKPKGNPPPKAPPKPEPKPQPSPNTGDNTPCISVVLKTIVKAIWKWVFDKPKK